MGGGEEGVCVCVLWWGPAGGWAGGWAGGGWVGALCNLPNPGQSERKCYSGKFCHAWHACGVEYTFACVLWTYSLVLTFSRANATHDRDVLCVYPDVLGTHTHNAAMKFLCYPSNAH